MQEPWNTVLAILASLGGGVVIVFGLSSWLGKIWAVRILAKEKNELDILSKEHEIRFSKLHYEQVEVLKTLYVKLLQIKRSCSLIAKYFEHKDRMREELNEELKEKGSSSFSSDLRKFYEENEIFLPDIISPLIEQILESDSMIWFSACTELGDENKDAMSLIGELESKLATAMKELKKEFKELLGHRMRV